MSNFDLTPALRQFVSLAAANRRFGFGDKFPVSIRRRYSFSQTLYVFPDGDYSFFMGKEIVRIFMLAEALNLEVLISSLGSVPVIEIADYNMEGK